MKRWQAILVNVLAFDATWSAALFAAARGWAWLGAGVMLANVVVYLLVTGMMQRRDSRPRSGDWAREAGLIVCSA